jgi:hypothetical protein
VVPNQTRFTNQAPHETYRIQKHSQDSLGASKPFRRGQKPDEHPRLASLGGFVRCLGRYRRRTGQGSIERGVILACSIRRRAPMRRAPACGTLNFVGNNYVMVCFRRVVLCLCLIEELKLLIVFDREIKVIDRV